MSLEGHPTAAPSAGPQAVAPAEPSLTIRELCRLERISKASLYKMWQAGTGPEYYTVGKGDRRISAAARRRWHERREVTRRLAV
jgi:hypothetical protein